MDMDKTRDGREYNKMCGKMSTPIPASTSAHLDTTPLPKSAKKEEKKNYPSQEKIKSVRSV